MNITNFAVAVGLGHLLYLLLIGDILRGKPQHIRES